MGYIQYMKWSDESVTKYKFSNHSKEEVIEILKEDIDEAYNLCSDSEVLKYNGLVSLLDQYQLKHI